MLDCANFKVAAGPSGRVQSDVDLKHLEACDPHVRPHPFLMERTTIFADTSDRHVNS